MSSALCQAVNIHLTQLSIDEFLSSDELWDGIYAADLAYVCTHGELDSPYYRLLLNDSKGYVALSTSPNDDGSVVALDSCGLTDSRTPPSNDNWIIQHRAHVTRRLWLGFAGPATITKGASARGRAFAEELLAGSPIAEAWLRAVHSTSPSSDRAIAIGLAEDEERAQSLLAATSLNDLPLPCKNVGGLYYRTCH